jgi:hypothetical protein
MTSKRYNPFSTSPSTVRVTTEQTLSYNISARNPVNTNPYDVKGDIVDLTLKVVGFVDALG